MACTPTLVGVVELAGRRVGSGNPWQGRPRDRVLHLQIWRYQSNRSGAFALIETWLPCFHRFDTMLHEWGGGGGGGGASMSTVVSVQPSYLASLSSPSGNLEQPEG